MRVIGPKTKLMEEADLFMLMVISMMASGKTIRHMAMVSTRILMAHSMKVIGLMINSTV